MEQREQVIVRRDGPIATVVLNRPEARNALSSEMLEGFAAALEQCDADDIRAVVIRGEGKAFCSGADVVGFKRVSDRGPEELSAHLQGEADLVHHGLVLKIRKLPKPVIASIGGVAAGAGFSIALACDLRIASRDARFFLAYANIGATADGGATYFLPRLLGPGLAMEAYLMNQPIGAERAMEMGLVNRVVPIEELEKHTMETASRLASGPTWAYARTKELMDRSWNTDLATHLDEEARAISEAALTADFQEGIRAFVEKRSPKFIGR